MDQLKNFIEGVTVPLLLSLFGGAARAMRYGIKSWRQFAGSLFVSGFAGVVVHLLLQDSDISSSLKAALVGLSGYSGGAILDGLATRLQRGVEKLPGQALGQAPEAEQIENRPWDGIERRRANPEDKE